MYVVRGRGTSVRRRARWRRRTPWICGSGSSRPAGEWRRGRGGADVWRESRVGAPLDPAAAGDDVARAEVANEIPAADLGRPGSAVAGARGDAGSGAGGTAGAAADGASLSTLWSELDRLGLTVKKRYTPASSGARTAAEGLSRWRQVSARLAWPPAQRPSTTIASAVRMGVGSAARVVRRAFPEHLRPTSPIQRAAKRATTRVAVPAQRRRPTGVRA